MYGRMNFSSSTSTVDYIINQIKTVSFGGLDLQPSYQRPFVWKDDFKDKLIYSIVKAYPIGNISVRVLGKEDKNPKGAKTEVVDGQQRLTTIRDFILNDYVIKSEWSKKIIEEMIAYYENAGETDPKLDKLKKKLENRGKVRLKYDDLPSIVQGNIKNYNLTISSIAEASDLQIREYFRFLQNQERLRAGEIINSMPPTNLEGLLAELDDKEKLLDIIGFSDDRREFDKIFYGMLGLFDGKISFGTTDKTIQEYAADAAELTLGLENAESMISQLNTITGTEEALAGATRKRYLKYLLLLTGFALVDFSEKTLSKLEELQRIDNMLSAFFSAKANVEQESFVGYSDAVREELRFIALLTKGGHSLQRTENRMKMLAYYINNPGEKRNPSGITPIEMQED